MMDIKPIYTPEDYKASINELMALEAYGLLNSGELLYIEVMIKLIEAFIAQRNPIQWCQQHCPAQ